MKNQPKIEFANSLRGIAALAVVMQHYLGAFWYSRQVAGSLANTTVLSPGQLPTPTLSHVIMAVPTSWGPFGVALFFLISGFLIPFAFDRRSAAGFLVGRIFRIYPLYFAGFTVTIAAIAMSGMWSGRPFPYDLTQVLIHYVPGMRDLLWSPTIDGIVWTLEIELKFYVVCALAAPLVRRGNPLLFVIPIVLFALVLQWSGLPWGTLRRTLAFSAEYMIFMFAGVSFNFWFRQRISIIGLGILTTAVLAMAALGMRTGREPTMTIVSYGEAFIFFALSVALSTKWKRTRVLSFFADISYPLYVVHGVLGYAILAYLTTIGVPTLLAVSATFVTAVAIAWILHVAVEMPTHRFGQRVADRIGKPITGKVVVPSVTL